jgi:ATP-dependent DNA ligase
VRDQPRILYASHFDSRGVELFRLVCEQDLEGIVCKHKLAPYASERVPWLKVLNPAYSQREGRRELFDKHRAARAGR